MVRITLTVAALLAFCGAASAETVSFRNDVMAVLSKAGCNQGTCHGNQNGKAGFKLSLRGEDPEWDHVAVTRDTAGRRTNPHNPAESLILQKATARTSHEGGRRFAADSPEYRIMLRWIGDGLRFDADSAPRLEQLEVDPAQRVMVEPDERIQLRVQAQFSDKTLRDVTRLAVYEPSNLGVKVSPDGQAERQQFGETSILVRYLDKQAVVQLAFVPARPDFAWKDVPEANYIDNHVFKKLRTLRMNPSELCSDSVFLRRAYLDSIGLLPTAEEARAFLEDGRGDRRPRLIDHLLQRPEFAEFWALKWSDLLRVEEKTLDRKGVQLVHQWLRQSIADSKPLDQLSRELIAARGSTYTNPPANFYRALRDPDTRSEAVAQVFLGIRLQCAKCHNHPFERWTQYDYHSLASFFTRIQYQIVENNRRDRLDKHEFDGEQIVWLAREGEKPHPRTGAPLRPLFLGADTPEFGPGVDRLSALAEWVTSPRNPHFARAQANRIWAHLLGRGIVEPIDDFRVTNPPVNAPLLDALAKDLVDHKFDLRHLVRTIMNSRTYQLSAVPNDTNREDESNFSHALVRPLQAEQLLDAVAGVTELPVKFNGYPKGLRAGQIPGVEAIRRRDAPPTMGEQFLKTFGKPERLLSCECERAGTPTLGHAFQLVSGPLVNDLLADPDNRLGRLLNTDRSNLAILEELCLAALGRLPTEKEQTFALAHLAKTKDRRTGLEDLLWGIVNSKEFLLRQ